VPHVAQSVIVRRGTVLTDLLSGLLRALPTYRSYALPARSIGRSVVLVRLEWTFEKSANSFNIL